MSLNEQKVVIFDLDDTLIPNVCYYRNTKQKVAVIFREYFGHGIQEDEVIRDLSALDLKKAEKLGLSRARFPLSAVELYLNYCNRFNKEVDQDELDNIFVTTNTVFDAIDKLSKSCIKVLKTVRKMGYKLYVLTSGDDVVQSFKIYNSDLFKYVDKENIIIVPVKTDDVYERYFSKYGLDNCTMVGNSRRSDINPALTVGMNSIFIPEETWEFEHATLKESDRLYTINSLSLVPETLDCIYGTAKTRLEEKTS